MSLEMLTVLLDILIIAIIFIGGLFTKHPKIKNTITAAGILTALYGTWAFVRPFVIKDAPGVDKTK